ncbi:MAG TPA: ATP-binding protein [Actinomycetota bacterium]
MVETRSTLRIPARAAYVGTARIFAAAVARQAGMGEEHVDDLKLAISEACAAGVRDDGDGSIVIHADLDGSAVSFEVSGQDIPPPPSDDLVSTPESFRRSIGYDVIRSLFPDASLPSKGSAAIRFSVSDES